MQAKEAAVNIDGLQTRMIRWLYVVPPGMMQVILLLLFSCAELEKAGGRLLCSINDRITAQRDVYGRFSIEYWKDLFI
jgi:hypothetical protein